MGLDTTHNAWHGSYTSFGEFRKNIAKAIGMNLDEMEGFGGTRPFSDFKHPILPLIDHSDCDGELSVEECKSIVEGIDMILANLVSSEGCFEAEWVKRRLILFSEGCKLAISKNESIEFK